MATGTLKNYTKYSQKAPFGVPFLVQEACMCDYPCRDHPNLGCTVTEWNGKKRYRNICLRETFGSEWAEFKALWKAEDESIYPICNTAHKRRDFLMKKFPPFQGFIIGENPFPSRYAQVEKAYATRYKNVTKLYIQNWDMFDGGCIIGTPRWGDDNKNIYIFLRGDEERVTHTLLKSNYT